MSTINVNYPNMAEGAEVEIPGLGVFKNGTETEIDDGDDLIYDYPEPPVETANEDVNDG
jgi:hypothetical protein